MKKSLITSIFLHFLILIGLGLSNLFFSKKIELNNINISVVSGNIIAPPKYKSLELTKEDLEKTYVFNNLLEFDDKKPITEPTKNSKKTSSKNIDTNVKNKNSNIPLTKAVKNTIKSPEVKDKSVDNISKQSYSTNEKTSEAQKNKDLFVNNIISGLSKGTLTKLEIDSLDKQLKGCWYNQGGYSYSENLKVELLLTMNPDATIKNIEVLNKETFNTPLRRTFLEQVLRALNDPKCKQLTLPPGAYDNWRIIHIIFDPKAKNND